MTPLDIIRTAIRNLKPMTATVHGHHREFCVHLVGTKKGDWRILTWQFGGGSEYGSVPSWRCFKFADLENLQIIDGERKIKIAAYSYVSKRTGKLINVKEHMRTIKPRWHRGEVSGTGRQTAIDVIDTSVALAFAAVVRKTSPAQTQKPALQHQDHRTLH
jgi:hypothetical protein